MDQGHGIRRALTRNDRGHRRLGVDHLQVRRQVRIINGQLVFSPPKGGKERRVPLVDAVALRLAAHIKDYTPVAVTLPLKVPTGKPVTAALLFTTPGGRAINRNGFNKLWRHARPVEIADSRENGCHVMRQRARGWRPGSTSALSLSTSGMPTPALRFGPTATSCLTRPTGPGAR
jgi:integrase